MSESDFNPLIFKKPLLENEENFSTIADGNLNTGDLQVPVTQAVDNLFAQYQQLQAQNEQLQDKFFALADVMYQMLAFINAQRLYQNRPAIMANDIANIIENNLVLAEITTHLRESAITSTLGIITQFDEAQEYLRQHVMQAWKERFAGEERQKLGEKLLGINAQESSNSKATENAPNGETPASKEPVATEATAHSSEENSVTAEQAEAAVQSEENSATAEQAETSTHSDENSAIAEQEEASAHSEENSATAEQAETSTHSEENSTIAEQAEATAHSEENSAIAEQAETAVQSEENSAIAEQMEEVAHSEENLAITEQAEATAHSEEHLATAQHTENSPISEQATHSAIAPPIDSALISHDTNIDDELIEQEVTITEADINQMQIEVHNDDLEDINYLKNQSYKVSDHDIDAEDFFDEAVD